MPVTREQPVECVGERHSFCAVIGSHFCDQHGSADRVFVARIGALKIAVAFLKAEQIRAFSGFLVLFDNLSDEFEAGEDIIHFDMVGFTDARKKLGGDNGFDGVCVCGNAAFFPEDRYNIVKQKRPHPVSGNADKLPVPVARHDPHPVAVGVGSDDKVGTGFLGECDSGEKNIRKLRVWFFDGRKISVRRGLARYNRQLFKAQPAENFRDKLPAGAMQRGVNDAHFLCCVQGAFGRHPLRENLVKEGFVDLLPDQDNAAVAFCFLQVAGANPVKKIDGGDFPAYGIGMLGRKLCTVLPVSFIAVIFLGIVACCDVDARNTAEVAQGKGKLGRRAQIVEKINLDAVCGKNRCGTLRIETGVFSAVVGDGNAAFTGIFFLDQFAEPLCCLHDRINIHSGKSGCHDAAKTCGTETQPLRKPAFDFCGIVADVFQLPAGIRVQFFIGKPFFIVFLRAFVADHFFLLMIK